MCDPAAPIEICEGLDDHKADHAKRGEAREQSDDDQQGEDEFCQCPCDHDGPMEDLHLADVITDSFHRFGEDLRVTANAGAEWRAVKFR